MNKFQTWWAEVRSSLWLLPTLLTLFSIGLAFLTLGLDRTTLAGLPASRLWWLFGGGAAGARGVLSAIASGIITVTGVVFSITIVALQLASSQFTPRVLKNFTSDLANQVVLGVFIGTFTYTLLIARAVRSRSEGTAEFIPSFSITISILLAVLSIGFLIFFIHHISHTIQASVLIDRVARDTLKRIDKNFPAMFGEPVARVVERSGSRGPEVGPQDDPEAAQSGAEEEVLGIATVPIRAREGGYLQSVDEDTIFDLAERGRLVVRMAQRIGDFVLPGSTLALAGPEDALSDTCQDEISRAFILGRERTPYLDVEYGVIELMDIAVKALSPGINDPTTAIMCIDRLGEILVHLGQREPPVAVRTGESGAHRFIARRGTFDSAVRLAFDQPRHYGANNPAIASRMIETLGRVAELIPEERRAPLREQVRLVLQVAQAAIGNRADLARVEAAAAVVLQGGVDAAGEGA